MGGTKSKPGKLTKTDFDLKRFVGDGTWYEIAHISNPLQRECENSIITISQRTMDTYNFNVTCYQNGVVAGTNSGKLTVGDPNVPSKMYLDMGWISAFTRASSEWWVFDTDYDSFAIVGTPSGYLWILSRKPTMSFCRYKDIRDLAMGYGFDTFPLKPDTNVLGKCTAEEVSKGKARPSSL